MTENEILLEDVEDFSVAIVEVLRGMLPELDKAYAVRWENSPIPTASLKNGTTSDPTPTVALDQRRMALSEAVGHVGAVVYNAKADLAAASQFLTEALDSYESQRITTLQ